MLPAEHELAIQSASPSNLCVAATRLVETPPINWTSHMHHGSLPGLRLHCCLARARLTVAQRCSSNDLGSILASSNPLECTKGLVVYHVNCGGGWVGGDWNRIRTLHQPPGEGVVLHCWQPDDVASPFRKGGAGAPTSHSSAAKGVSLET